MRIPRLQPETQFLILAAAVGAAGALVNAGFRELVSFCHGLLIAGEHELFEPLRMGWRRPVLFLLAPALGGLAVGLLGRFTNTDVGGYGLPSFLEKVNLRTNELTLRNTLLRALGAALTLGSGGSAGVEGPIASLGGGIASWIARARRLAGERLRVLIACGASAAVAAAYGAPIAGVFFTQEIILAGNYDLQNFVRVVVASGSATVVARAMRGDAPMFAVEAFKLVSPVEILFYLALGLTCGLTGALFSRMFFRVKRAFQQSSIDPMFRPAIGGALVGAIALGAPGVLGNGHEVIKSVLTMRHVDGTLLGFFALLVVGKMLATSLTIGSGGGGGIFGPSLCIGAVLGSLVGGVCAQWAPLATSFSSHYAMVGMGALLAATVRAPLTSIFLVFEMTGSSSTVVLPTLVAVAASLVVARKLESHSMDEVELARRGIHLKEGRELAVLQSVTAGQAMSPGFEGVPAGTTAPDLHRLVSSSRANAFIVVGADDRMVGILSLQDLRTLDQVTAERLGPLTIASDLCEGDVVTIYSDESLATALAKMDKHGFRQLPVVARSDPRKVLGMLERQHILSAYRHHLLETQSRAASGDGDAGPPPSKLSWFG